MLPRPPHRDTVHGRIGYLLALVALLHFIYPITLRGNTVALIAYQVLYAAMFFVGVLVVSDSRRHLITSATFALIWVVCAIVFSLDPTNPTKALITYLALIPFQANLIWALMRYIFTADHIGTDVLLTAITVYILLAALFVSIYGSIEVLQPGAFVDNGTGQPVFWQQFVYFSITTLTTTGYGDILPVNAWARAFANIEQVIGVLYIAVLMGRLVGLFTPQKPA